MGIWKLFESNFERFRRIEGDATLDLSGLGLGLSITKSVCRNVRWRDQSSSTLGLGSVFTFTIPLDIDQTAKVIQPKKSKIGCQEF
jgi:signal transduction histidine kinase